MSDDPFNFKVLRKLTEKELQLHEKELKYNAAQRFSYETQDKLTRLEIKHEKIISRLSLEIQKMIKMKLAELISLQNNVKKAEAIKGELRQLKLMLDLIMDGAA